MIPPDTAQLGRLERQWRDPEVTRSMLERRYRLTHVDLACLTEKWGPKATWIRTKDDFRKARMSAQSKVRCGRSA